PSRLRPLGVPRNTLEILVPICYYTVLGRHLFKRPERCVKQAKPRDGGCSQGNPALRYSRAGVAEWQTQRTQNPPGSRPCRFDSYLRHQLLFRAFLRAFSPRSYPFKILKTSQHIALNRFNIARVHHRYVLRDQIKTFGGFWMVGFRKYWLIAVTAAGVGLAVPANVAAQAKQSSTPQGKVRNEQLKHSGAAKSEMRKGADKTFLHKGWHHAGIPATVVGVLVTDKTYPDPNYGTNLANFPGMSISDKLFFANVD